MKLQLLHPACISPGQIAHFEPADILARYKTLCDEGEVSTPCEFMLNMIRYDTTKMVAVFFSGNLGFVPAICFPREESNPPDILSDTTDCLVEWTPAHEYPVIYPAADLALAAAVMNQMHVTHPYYDAFRTAAGDAFSYLAGLVNAEEETVTATTNWETLVKPSDN